MTDSSQPINITILDKDYKVACPIGKQSALLASAKYLDTKMREVRSNSSIIGAERIAIITALNITNDLLNADNDNSHLNTNTASRLKKLETKINQALLDNRATEI